MHDAERKRQEREGVAMSEHRQGADLEYGPTPPGAKHEHTDIDVEVGYKFALWLAVAMTLSFAIVYGTFWFFERQQRAAGAAAQQYPLAAPQPLSGERVERPLPTPALQTQPFRDIYELRASETEKLQSYGWVDKEGGVAHVPIDVAMEILIRKGLPTRPEGGSGAGVVVQDSSSGRTSAPR
jgi:hypothetical protein